MKILHVRAGSWGACVEERGAQRKSAKMYIVKSAQFIQVSLNIVFTTLARVVICLFLETYQW